ncbi:phospholipase carboxylesterase [Ophiostoma piceae UAMH 11346]|uniref:Phospholipase carboxylesterase n=1 Tax=Ophiostoma piceae (strain UAMH 11346) TaxID=1262450 RepID=S3C3Y5_OPHP1|nr:phospholipase carboxylesterase [Ophiostoma piceae UAMH 11346]
MATQITMPAAAPETTVYALYSSSSINVNNSINNGVSYLDRRADGRPLDWRTGLPPMVGGIGLQHLQSQKHLSPFSPVSPVPSTRGRSRVTRNNPERIRYDMNDFVKSTVWANHDMLRLRASEMACSHGSQTSKAIFVDGELGGWLEHTNVEHLHIHDADGTTHMILSLADATTAIEYGWAQADATNAWTAWTCGNGVQYVTVFPPRCASEMGDWKRLVLASVRVCTSASQDVAIRRPERL